MDAAQPGEPSPETQVPGAALPRAGSLGIAALALVAFAALYLPYLPAEGGRLGHDYALYLPQLVAGQHLFEANGPFAVPWFAPAFCGGIPFYPNPQNIYYSVPQWLSFALPPMVAVRLTFLAFAGLGFAGLYALLRRGFSASPWASLMGACLFTFDAFYPHRILIGHLSFHGVMLAPWVALLLLRAAQAWGDGRRRWLPPLAGASALVAYLFYAGAVHLLIPLYLAWAACVILAAHRGGRPVLPALIPLMASGPLAALLAASKLVAGASLLAHIPRDMYPLPGFPDALEGAAILVKTLFFRPDAAWAGEALQGSTFALQTHELEYSLSPVPLAVGALSVGALLWRRSRGEGSSGGRSLGVAAAVVGLSLIPLVVNLYTPSWNAILKAIPVIKDSSSLLRWWIYYVMLLPVVTGLALMKARLPRRGEAAVALAGMILAITWQATADRSFYAHQPYDPSGMTRAHARARAEGPLPITAVIGFADDTGHVQTNGPYNEAFADGYAGLYCYEPILGYRLERFRRAPLVIGPSLEPVEGGVLNVKDPACYVFPDENGCAPGDHFRADQIDAARAFLAWQISPFERSGAQRAADAVTLLSALSLLIVSLVGGMRRPPGSAS